MAKSKLKLLADESLEYRLVKHLRKNGYEVASIAEESPSISDKSVLGKANKENRILLTNDKDFGELIFVNKLKHKGVALFRVKSEKIKDKIKVLDKLLADYSDNLKGNFVVVDEGKVRIR